MEANRVSSGVSSSWFTVNGRISLWLSRINPSATTSSSPVAMFAFTVDASQKRGLRGEAEFVVPFCGE